MEYYQISKSDKIFKTEKKFDFRNGYRFNQKLRITLYNRGMINYILNKKLTNSLKNIINLYLLYEDDDENGSENRANELIPKIETLRAILIEKYASYLTETEIESYLTKLEKLENKIGQVGMKKSRSM